MSNFDTADFVRWSISASNRFPVEIALLREMASIPDYSVPDMLRVITARGDSSLSAIPLSRVRVFMAAFHLSLGEAASVGGWDGSDPTTPDHQLQLDVSRAIEAHRTEWEREWDASKR